MIRPVWLHELPNDDTLINFTNLLRLKLTEHEQQNVTPMMDNDEWKLMAANFCGGLRIPTNVPRQQLAHRGPSVNTSARSERSPRSRPVNEGLPFSLSPEPPGFTLCCTSFITRLWPPPLVRGGGGPSKVKPWTTDFLPSWVINL